MAFSRIRPGGWGLNDQVSSAQLNAIDLTLVNALDKTVAGDTISGPITFSGQGRFRESCANGADASQSYNVSVQHTLRLTSSITAPRTYTLGATGAVENDIFSIYADNDFTSVVTVVDGATAATLTTIGWSDPTAACVAATFVWKSGAWHLRSQSRSTSLRQQTFLVNGNWVCPPGVYRVLLIGMGGGGGGGGGCNGSTSTGAAFKGGGGGGGAQLASQVVSTVPGTSYAVVIATGGTGGLGGPSPTNGGNGGDTTFGGTIAVFRGAGAGSVSTNSALDNLNNAAGGSPYKTRLGGSESNLNEFERVGGWGGRSNYGSRSARGGSNERFVGGDAELYQGTSGSYYAGTSGGGGGASGTNDGMAGGIGGTANSGGAGNAGAAGASPTTERGSGGGGGGGGGCGLSAGGAGGNGGAGGPGILTIVWT